MVAEEEEEGGGGVVFVVIVMVAEAVIATLPMTRRTSQYRADMHILYSTILVCVCVCVCVCVRQGRIKILWCPKHLTV